MSTGGLKGDIARLRSDKGTHEGRPTVARMIQRVLTRPGPLAIVLYRASHALWAGGLETPAELLWRLNFFLTGADIHPGAEIGGGLRLTHTAGVVVGKGARIGANVTLLHGVTLGGSSRGFYADDSVTPDGFPTVGDGSKIAAGAKLLGPITIGRECFVGANAVVAKDLPDGTVFNAGRDVSELRKRVDELESELRELKQALSEREPRPSG